MSRVLPTGVSVKTLLLLLKVWKHKTSSSQLSVNNLNQAKVPTTAEGVTWVFNVLCVRYTIFTLREDWGRELTEGDPKSLQLNRTKSDLLLWKMVTYS